jgi:hypothetical protein
MSVEKQRSEQHGNEPTSPQFDPLIQRDLHSLIAMPKAVVIDLMEYLRRGLEASCVDEPDWSAWEATREVERYEATIIQFRARLLGNGDKP